MKKSHCVKKDGNLEACAVGDSAVRAAHGFSGAHAESRWPDFIIIGAAKSGTTTIYKYLARHPKIFMPKVKEPEFFSTSRFIEHKEWYHSLFEPAREGQLHGEASTDYTRWPHTGDVPRQIHKWLPDVKLIYIMRHPVERAYSQYAHDMRKGVTMSFEEALRASDLYVDSSMYILQIQRYMRYFPRESFLFLTTDDLHRDSYGTMHQIQGFLGIDLIDLVGARPLKANQGGTQRGLEYFVRYRIKSRLRKYGLWPLAATVPGRVRRSVFKRVRLWLDGTGIAQKHKLPPVGTETRLSLLEKFREPNRSLASFLSRDLSHWNT